MTIEISKGQQVTGRWRAEVAAEARRMYVDEGMTIRAIAERLERSYGFVHRLLAENEVEFSPRGGANHGGGGHYSTRVAPRELSQHEAREYAERMRGRKIK